MYVFVSINKMFYFQFFSLSIHSSLVGSANALQAVVSRWTLASNTFFRDNIFLCLRFEKSKLLVACEKILNTKPVNCLQEVCPETV